MNLTFTLTGPLADKLLHKIASDYATATIHALLPPLMINSPCWKDRRKWVAMHEELRRQNGAGLRAILAPILNDDDLLLDRLKVANIDWPEELWARDGKRYPSYSRKRVEVAASAFAESIRVLLVGRVDA